MSRECSRCGVVGSVSGIRALCDSCYSKLRAKWDVALREKNAWKAELEALAASKASHPSRYRRAATHTCVHPSCGHLEALGVDD